MKSSAVSIWHGPRYLIESLELCAGLCGSRWALGRVFLATLFITESKNRNRHLRAIGPPTAACPDTPEANGMRLIRFPGFSRKGMTGETVQAQYNIHCIQYSSSHNNDGSLSMSQYFPTIC